MARVVFVESWYRGSHRAWADAVVARSRHDIRLVTHAGVHWQWRLQGSAPTLAPLVADAIADLGGIDVLATTSSVPVAPLVGLLRHELGGAAVVHYLHENQLTYPTPDGVTEDLTYSMIDWLSLLAADRVLVNSRFHRDELFAALPTMLARFPDHPHGGFVDDVAQRCGVVEPGVDTDRFRASGTRPDGPLRVLWPHRWEHDKRPDRFVAAMRRLAAVRPEIRVDIVGSGVTAARVGADIEPIRAHVDRLGAPDRADYEQTVATADIVVSTAEHEFYGLAMAEAMAAGAVPVAPRRLAYPDLIPAPVHPQCLYDDDDGLDARLLAFTDPAVRAAVATRTAASVRSIAAAVGAYDDALDEATPVSP